MDKEGEPLAIFGNVKSLVYHENNDEDPYITMPDNLDDEVEREDLQILESDNLVLAARIEDEMAHLEVYVYEDEADNLYVHHDIASGKRALKFVRCRRYDYRNCILKWV